MIGYAINCWEFMQCGREPGGANTYERGVCQVTTCEKLDGVHNGKNGGRCCWIFFSIFSCGAGNPKNLKEHIATCRQCAFYILLHESEELLVVL